ncbi:MAG TPA: secretion protein [Anaeromyxobacteraceae bacterium]|nr:secretion protein [Anaeromyxobacteraceae bacterium]
MARTPLAAPAALLLVAVTLSGCGEEEILHGLAEPQVNEILVALDDVGIAGRKVREDGADGGWTVAVGRRDAARAQRILAERELPRPRSAGFGDVFGRGGMVPTPTEEHALYLHALAGELSRSLEAIDGVVEARVHFGLPQGDPLRPGDPRPPRAAALVKCRPSACDAVRGLERGIRDLVAGAADGLDPSAVAVVVAAAVESASRPLPPPRSSPSPLLLVLAGVAATGAAALAALGLRSRLRRSPPA